MRLRAPCKGSPVGCRQRRVYGEDQRQIEDQICWTATQFACFSWYRCVLKRCEFEWKRPSDVQHQRFRATAPRRIATGIPPRQFGRRFGPPGLRSMDRGDHEPESLPELP